MFPISEFDQNGFAFPIPVMNSSEAAALAGQIMRFQSDEPEKAARAFGTNTHLLFPSLCEVIQREQILDAVEQVFGRDVDDRMTAMAQREGYGVALDHPHID